MKNQISKIALTACLSLMAGLAFAQAPNANNVAPPPPPVGRPGEMPPPPPIPGMPNAGPVLNGELKTLTVLTGKITAYVANDRYIYNCFTMQTGNQLSTVEFPEGLGLQLMNAAKKGETITVKGFNDVGPDGVSRFHFVSATAGKSQIADTPPATPLEPVTAVAKTYTGSIIDFKRDQLGGINGLNLDNKIVVDLPSHVMQQLQTLLKTGDKIEVSGFKDTPPAGVALVANAPTMIHPETITVNGQTYLLR